jgi:hypothetical protein
MTRKKPPAASLVRSSAAEYLTFVAASGTGGVEAIYADENVWLSQKMMAQLYDVETPTINYHLKRVFADSELEEGAVIRKFLITAADGKTYDTKHFNRRDRQGPRRERVREVPPRAGSPLRERLRSHGGCEPAACRRRP